MKPLFIALLTSSERVNFPHELMLDFHDALREVEESESMRDNPLMRAHLAVCSLQIALAYQKSKADYEAASAPQPKA